MAVPQFHHWPVVSVTWQFKVPRASNSVSHTSMAVRINQEKLVQNTGVFPPVPVPSLIPQIESGNLMAQEFACLKSAQSISVHVVLNKSHFGELCSRAEDLKPFHSCTYENLK